MCVHGEVNDIQAHAKIVAGPKKTALVSGAWPLPGLCDTYCCHKHVSLYTA